MKSFRSELLSIKIVKDKIISVKKTDSDFSAWSIHDYEFKILVFFIQLVHQIIGSKSMDETFQKLESINFFAVCAQTIDKDFTKVISVVIKTLCTLLKPEEVILFTQLSNTTTNLILTNYETIPFQMSANKNLKNNYDARVANAIEQCKLVEQCHHELRQLLPNNMSQFVVLLNNLLLPLEK